MARFQKMYDKVDLQFVGHISAYAGCNTRFRDDENVTKPILLLHGTADDLTPIALCREYAERLSKAGKTARIIEYPDAYHQFDAPMYRTALKFERVGGPWDGLGEAALLWGQVGLRYSGWVARGASCR